MPRRPRGRRGTAAPRSEGGDRPGRGRRAESARPTRQARARRLVDRPLPRADRRPPEAGPRRRRWARAARRRHSSTKETAAFVVIGSPARPRAHTLAMRVAATVAIASVLLVLVVQSVFGGTGALGIALAGGLSVAILAGWFWLATLFVRAGPSGLLAFLLLFGSLFTFG